MNASVDWLRAFVPLDQTPNQIREMITAHTAPVDELVPLRADLAPIVVARVVEAGRHPDSDHLWVTKVDAGGGELLEVVCGAPNVTAGKLYPFAPVGTTMPNGMKLDRRKIRGVVSNGMLCSAKELGLGDNHEGILELTIDAAPGTKFLAAMPVGDARLVIDVGANRADLQSHIGLARELAAVTGQEWRLPEIPGLSAAIPKAKPRAGSGVTGGVAVRVDANTETRRYMAALVRGVKVGRSPDWLVRRLDAVGVRSINNVVDSTNYVLHELGQPVHAFDASKLSGGVVVRLASSGEKLTTLDGIERSLPAEAVVIADAQRAHAVAGVMGGKESEVTDATQDILIEVAVFDPRRTRVARHALGLSTDASYRFERGVDVVAAPTALDRVTRLIVTLAGGAVAGAPADVVGALPKARTISLRMKRVTQILGVRIPPAKAKQYLMRAGFKVPKATATGLSVTVPSWRDDVRAEVDLVEEVARFHGYNSFPNEIRAFRPTTTFDDPVWGLADRLRTLLVGLGIHEALPLVFVKGSPETHTRVANPISEEEAYLRTSMFETLSRSAELNLSHRVGDVRLFEIGSVFAKSGSAMPTERVHLGVLLMGNRRPPHYSDPQPGVVDEWDIKGVAEAAARVAFAGETTALVPASDHLWDVTAGGRTVGRVVRLQLDAPVWASPAFAVEMTLASVASAAPAPKGQHNYMEGGRPPAPKVAKFRALPSTPAAEFDLALIVPNSRPAADVERALRESAGDLLESLTLFDQYTGQGIPAGTRSLAWRLTFRHPERTLRDKEIEGRRSKILRVLEDELNVRQRTT